MRIVYGIPPRYAFCFVILIKLAATVSVVQLARSKNVEELATDPQRHAFREAAAAAAEQRLAQECTFVPDTSKPGVPGTSGVEPKAPFTVCGQKSDNIIERFAPGFLYVTFNMYYRISYQHYIFGSLFLSPVFLVGAIFGAVDSGPVQCLACSNT